MAKFTTMYKPLVLFIETLITPDSCHESGTCERDHTISLQIFRSSHQRCFVKKGVPKNFGNCSEKQLRWSFSLIKFY